MGVVCTGAAQIEKAMAVKSGRGSKIRSSPQHLIVAGSC